MAQKKTTTTTDPTSPADVETLPVDVESLAGPEDFLLPTEGVDSSVCIDLPEGYAPARIALIPAPGVELCRHVKGMILEKITYTLEIPPYLHDAAREFAELLGIVADDMDCADPSVVSMDTSVVNT